VALRRRFRVALALALLGCAFFGALLASPLSGDTREIVSAAGLLLAGAAMVIGGSLTARRTPPGRRRRAWVILTSAAGLGMASNIWSTVTHSNPVLNPNDLAETGFAAAMLLSIVGLLQLPSVRQRGEQLMLMVLDGLVMGGAVLVIVSITVYSKSLEPDKGGAVLSALRLVLPLLDVVLVTVALLLILRSQEARGLFLLIAAGFLLYAVSDLAFAVEAAQKEYAAGSIQDVGWIAGYLLFAAAAWHPDAASPTEERTVESGYEVLGTVLVFGVLLTALGVQLLAAHEHEKLTATQIVLRLLFVLAVGIRQSLLTADNAKLREGLEQRVREQTADLRRMAHRTETLLRSVGDGIYGVDLDGRISFINPSGARTLGHEPSELLGADAHALFHAPRADGSPFPSTGCYITEAIRHGHVSSAEEDTYLRADGSTFPVEITSSPLVDEERISGAVVVFRDVTQRHEVDRMKNEFLSVVSHELRTPLTSIRGSLGLVASGSLVELTPQAERMVSIAVESSERLTRLINDILDIERIQSGKLPMHLAPQQARHLLEATATEMSGLAALAGVRLEVVAGPARVLADPDRIRQALTNLVGNAVKFSPAGGVVRLEAVDGDHEVTFAVRDQGRGIPADKLESIFEPFEQVDSTDARLKGGTGLGLSICRGIVERHGGRIWADSSPEVGTTVRFTLPRQRPAVGAGENGSPDAPVVLVCDDDLESAAAVSGMLDRHGYRPLAVTDASEVLTRAAVSRPAAVLLATGADPRHGAELLAGLKDQERTRAIPVIAISDPAADGPPSGAADGWLVGPVSEERLIATVASTLDRRRQDAVVLIVEDDEDLAGVLTALLTSHGLEVLQAGTVADAIAQARILRPHVVVLDLALPDGEGTEVVARLRAEGVLSGTAVVVYSAADALDERAEVVDDGTVFLTKARATPEELEDRVLRLIDARTTMGGDLEDASINHG